MHQCKLLVGAMRTFLLSDVTDAVFRRTQLQCLYGRCVHRFVSCWTNDNKLILESTNSDSSRRLARVCLYSINSAYRNLQRLALLLHASCFRHAKNIDWFMIELNWYEIWGGNNNTVSVPWSKYAYRRMAASPWKCRPNEHICYRSLTINRWCLTWSRSACSICAIKLYMPAVMLLVKICRWRYCMK